MPKRPSALSPITTAETTAARSTHSRRGVSTAFGGDDEPRSPFVTDLRPGARYVLPLKYSLWLCLSSLAFLVPAFVAVKYSDPVPWLLVVCFTVTSAVSVNYWRRCCVGWRRDLDLFVAKASFAVTIAYGAMTIDDPFLLKVGWPLACFIPVLFWCAIWLEKRESVLWIAAHAMMHVAVAAGMTLVVIGADKGLRNERKSGDDGSGSGGGTAVAGALSLSMRRLKAFAVFLLSFATMSTGMPFEVLLEGLL